MEHKIRKTLRKRVKAYRLHPICILGECQTGSEGKLPCIWAWNPPFLPSFSGLSIGRARAKQ